MAEMQKKRLQNELQALLKDPPEGIHVDADNISSDLQQWIINVDGTTGTWHEGKVFKLKITFGSHYPFEPPQILFIPPNIPSHPLISSRGQISMLTNDWLPSKTVKSLCLSVSSMLSNCKKKIQEEEDDDDDDDDDIDVDELSSNYEEEQNTGPYNTEELARKWDDVRKLIPQRDSTLQAEVVQQENNERLRHLFAQKANAIGQWIETRLDLVASLGLQRGTLDDQLGRLRSIEKELSAYRHNMDDLESYNQDVQEAMIFENRHTPYSMETLRIGWEQLLTSVARNTNELENQSADSGRKSSHVKSEAKNDDDNDDDDDNDAPLGAKGHIKRKLEGDDFTQKSVKKEEQESKKKGRKKLNHDAADDTADETKWQWWKENKHEEGIKWHTLEHNGPVFAPPYEPLPSNVKFYYNGKVVQLSENAEEVATFYAKMLDTLYTARDTFNLNFFVDWQQAMTSKERELICDLTKCNFTEIGAYFKAKSAQKKNMSKDEKLALMKENEEVQKEFGFCIIDGHKQEIGSFKIEPPGLFRGLGQHPKQGKVKRRILPEDVIINCSKGSNVPNPPAGHNWKSVRHDNTVTWLACWRENIQGSIKYIMLNSASKLKGEKDLEKYETARRLHKCVDKIRMNYREEWKSDELKIRQRAVALYLIDTLALRAGNEKDEDTADTVGCCSLRVEHIKLNEEMNGQEFVIELDFLGKDSIHYYNAVAVEKLVFKNLKQFLENKKAGDEVFNCLSTAELNKHLNGLMDGLTAKVFRTFNASRTLQENLDLLTDSEDSITAKVISYNRANRAVAKLCNHQRAVPKTFDKQMENIQAKIDAKTNAINKAEKDLKDAKSEYEARRSETAKNLVAKKERALENLKEQLKNLEVQATDKEENKEIALSTSKLNYLDPRITVAWCRKWEVPIEKVYNKSEREKFAWAIDMADKYYRF